MANQAKAGKISRREFMRDVVAGRTPARPYGNRPPRRYFLIVCEGEETEPNYFNAIAAQLPKDMVNRITVKGVGKNTLLNALFSGRDLIDPNHALHSLMYNARKRLQSFGLPRVNYFVQKEGRYYWTDQIRIVDDSKEFERLIAEADQSEDKDEKIDILRSISIRAISWRNRSVCPGSQRRTGA